MARDAGPWRSENSFEELPERLMSDAGGLRLDEPSLGLAPLVVKAVFEPTREIRDRQSKAVVRVEQKALALCDEACVLENGAIVLQGQSAELLSKPAIRKTYLGHDYV